MTRPVACAHCHQSGPTPGCPLCSARASLEREQQQQGCDPTRFGGHADDCRCFSLYLRLRDAERETI